MIFGKVLIELSRQTGWQCLSVVIPWLSVKMLQKKSAAVPRALSRLPVYPPLAVWVVVLVVIINESQVVVLGENPAHECGVGVRDFLRAPACVRLRAALGAVLTRIGYTWCNTVVWKVYTSETLSRVIPF